MNFTSLISGIVFIVLGVVFFLERLSVVDVSASFVIPVLLIGIGVGVVLGSRRSRPEPADEQGPPRAQTE